MKPNNSATALQAGVLLGEMSPVGIEHWAGGTLSTFCSRGLRVGWRTAPAPLLSALARVRQATGLHTSTLAQAILGRAAADDPRLAAHIAAARALYPRRTAQRVAPGPAFSPSGATNTSAARRGFASVDETQLTEAVRCLTSAHEQLNQAGPLR